MKISMRKFFNSKILKFIPADSEHHSHPNESGHVHNEEEEEIVDDEGIQKALNDPGLSEDERRMIKKQLRQQSIQPPQFNKMDNFCKICLEDDKWIGLRGVFDWTPNNMNKIEYTLTIDNPKFKLNNYKVNLMSICPYSDHSQSGAFLIGRKCPKMKALQGFFNITENSKIHLTTQHPKEDMSQGYYGFEYVHDFERLNLAYKFSNMESAISLISPIYRNIFFGFEATKNPAAMEFIYNLGLLIRPSPMTYNFGLCAQYNPRYPMVSTDFCYKKHNWQFYLSFMKNWHHMAAMSGQDFDLKGNMVYSQNENYEFNLELNHEGTISLVHTHHLAKRFAVQANLGINPWAHKSAKNQKVFRRFGIGIKFSSTTIEEEVTGIEPQDDFDEFEFDKISSQIIK